MSGEPLIYLIAGEPSGDLLGGRLMAALKERTGGAVHFAGIGGEAMAAEGLESLVPLAELAVMGVAEVTFKPGGDPSAYSFRNKMDSFDELRLADDEIAQAAGAVALAAWRALYQLVAAPYAWEKTEHGLARSSRRADRTTQALLALERHLTALKDAGELPELAPDARATHDSRALMPKAEPHERHAAAR